MQFVFPSNTPIQTGLTVEVLIPLKLFFDVMICSTIHVQKDKGKLTREKKTKLYIHIHG